MKNWFDKIRAFFKEVREEVLKCTRPSWEELRESTLVIVVTMIILGLFLFASDWGISWCLSKILTVI